MDLGKDRDARWMEAKPLLVIKVSKEGEETVNGR